MSIYFLEINIKLLTYFFSILREKYNLKLVVDLMQDN